MFFRVQRFRPIIRVANNSHELFTILHDPHIGFLCYLDSDEILLWGSWIEKKGFMSVQCFFAKISLNLMLKPIRTLVETIVAKLAPFCIPRYSRRFLSHGFPSYLNSYLIWSTRSASMIQPYIKSRMKSCKGCPARSKLKQSPQRLDLLLCRREVRNLAISYSLKRGYYNCSLDFNF